MEAVYGAKHIIVLGLPDFSITPRYIFTKHSVASIKKADVKIYNDQLKDFVIKNRALGHDIAYYDVDKMLIHSPALLNQYQITDFRHSCLYRGGEPNQNNWKAMGYPQSLFYLRSDSFLRDALPNLDDYRNHVLPKFTDKSCGSHYLFWDTLHPTKKNIFLLFKTF